MQGRIPITINWPGYDPPAPYPEPVKIFRADRVIQAYVSRVEVCNLFHVSASKFDGQH